MAMRIYAMSEILKFISCNICRLYIQGLAMKLMFTGLRIQKIFYTKYVA